MFRTERRIIIFNYENILNKLGKDKILIVILAGILLMVISIPVKDRLYQKAQHLIRKAVRPHRKCMRNM